MKDKYIGKYRITEMEQWDQEFVDMLVPGHVTLKKDEIGNFQFGAVEGEIDYRIENVEGQERVEFSWRGVDEGDEVCGRGWAELKDDELHGRLYFHMGDDSGFVAKKKR